MAKKKKKVAAKRRANSKSTRARTPLKGASKGKPQSISLKSRPLLIGLGILMLLSTWTYLPSLDGAFTNWDDEEYVLMNGSLQELNSENLKTIFSDPVQGNYHPLTMLSLGLSYNEQIDANGNVLRHQRKGYILPDPQPFHLGNLILHLLSTILLAFFVFTLFDRKWMPAVLVAGIFALHPMHVESVAWITARKDVLYGLFFIAGLWTYLIYTRKKKIGFLAATLVLFGASVLSKPAAVVFPLLLFAIDYWESRDLSIRTVLEKVPFLIVSLIIGLLTVRYQSVDAIGDWDRFSLWERIMYASHSFVGYIVKFFYPVPLKIFYPYPTFGDPPLTTQVAPIAVLLIIGLAVYGFKKHKALSFGILFYSICIGLVLQFVSVGGAIMAERYTYIPYIGLSLPLAWYLQKMLDSKKYESLAKGLAIFGALALILFAWQSRARTAVWQDDEALYSSVLKIHPNLHGILLNRGNYYLDNESFEKARKDYQRAVRVKPDDSDALFNIALIYNSQGQYQKAINILDTAIAINKNDYTLYTARGDNYKLLNKFQKAVGDYNKSIRLVDNDVLAYLNRGICQFSLNKLEEAKADFIKVIELQPNSPEGFNNVGYLLLQQKNYPEARTYLLKALKIDPQNVNALSNMAIYHSEIGEKAKARNYIQQLEKLGPRVDKKYLQNLKKQLGFA